MAVGVIAVTGGIVETIIVGMLSAAFGGAITAVAAVAAVRVEIKWLTATSSRQETAIVRAHDRCDMIEGRLMIVETRLPPVVYKPG